ncbi:MAG: hypothetical protein JOZ72_18420 [Alphaproteobacteria bacterium]|nr:hypothetical protein [Alphaproteobacteria bacterium]
MTILQIDPNAPQWVHDAATAILYAHIGGGTLGMIAGTVALFSRKGETLHRAAGTVFFAAMLTMAGVGAAVAPFLEDPASTVAGIMTFYLVLSGWMTVRRPEGTVGRFERAAVIVPVLVALSGLTLAYLASHGTLHLLKGQPYQAFYVFAGVGTIAALSDLKVLWRGGITGAARLARHIWRMCTALTVATGSFFLGQQKMLPAALHHSGILFLPVIVPLLTMAFWLVAVRFWASRPKPALGEAR